MEKRKLIYVLTGVMGIVIIFILVVSLINSCGKRKSSFEKVESNMKKAAQQYLKDNANLLPIENNESITIDSSTLVNGKYMDQLSDMVKDGVDCSGKVIITKNGTKYLYSPILNCGAEYQTKKLVDVVKSDNPTVTSGDGLYLVEGGSRFKGEYVNNYVKIGNLLWRIIDIDSDGFIRLLYVDKSTENLYVWDDRYNVDREENAGINNYEVSRIKESLISAENSGLYISDDYKVNLAYKDICVGKRSSSNTALNSIEECEVKISDQLFGLPYPTDYLAASIDPNCQTTDDASCENYNYLMATSLSSWTLIGEKERTYRAYSVNINGISSAITSSEKAIRPTVYLSNNVLYGSGNGTKEAPYVVK